MKIKKIYFAFVFTTIIFSLGFASAQNNPGHPLSQIDNLIKTCGPGFVQNITSTGPVCATPSGGGGGEPNCGNPGQCTDVYADSASAEIIAKYNGAAKARLLAYSNGGVFELRDSVGDLTARIGSEGNSYFTGGRVGIGTSDPTSTLTVNGGIASGSILSSGVIYSEVSTQTYAGSIKNTLNNIGSNGLLVDVRNSDSATNAFRVQTGSPVTERFAVAGDGTVWVKTLGTSTNTHLCITTAGKLSSCSSSSRYKKDIKDFNEGLNAVKKLRPVTFNWKESNEKDVGFIAEEVEKINPLFVTYDDAGKRVEGVKYDQLTAILVNAVQEQQSQIEQQNKVIWEQHNEIIKMKKAICEINPDSEVCNN